MSSLDSWSLHRTHRGGSNLYLMGESAEIQNIMWKKIVKQLVTLKMCNISHDMVDAKTELECFKGRKNYLPFPLTHRVWESAIRAGRIGS